MTNRLNSLRNDAERGWVLVTAIMLLSIMIIMGLAAMSLVDNQQKRSRQQRERESTLNLSESALYQMGFKLAQGWPTAGKPAHDCSSTVSDPSFCPPAAQVQANANNVDTQANASWSTVVRDNGGPLSAAYVPAQMNAAQSGTDASNNAYTCASPCNYDANGDRKVWVQAESIVRGRKRTVVATMKLERLQESVPQTAVVAGGIDTGNNGSQVKIYAVGSQVTVRCNPSNSSCVSDGAAVQPSATQGNPPPMMTLNQIKRFRDRAINDGTYYATCANIPGSSTYDLSGSIVFVENCTDMNASLAFPNNVASTCSGVLPAMPSGSGGNGLQPNCINYMTRPGLVIWHCGSLGTSGKGTFIGILYFPNGSDNDPDHPCTPRGSTTDCNGSPQDTKNVLSTTGGLGILGAVAIDGMGCLHASANGIQVQYDPNVFNAVASYGTVGLVQDTWREMVPG